MRSILVTNTGDAVHAKALAARTDIQVTFVTEPRFTDMYPPETDIVFVDNLNEPANAARTVIEQRNCNHYEAVISLSERAAQTAAYLRDYLGLEGPSFHTITNCTNKFAMKQRFSSAEIPTADYAIATSLNDIFISAAKIGWPIIVKPIIGAGADATMIFKDEDELFSKKAENFFSLLQHPKTTSEKEFPVIVEKFLNVIKEFHCDGYVENGKIVFAKVSQYIKPVIEYTSGGIYGSFTIHPSDPLASEILAMHEKAVKATGIINGVTHFEVFLTPNGLVAGEIACRPGGGGIRKMLKFQSGFDSWDAHIAVSLGNQYVWEYPEHEEEPQVIELMLPTKRGRVRTISSADDFNDVPGLLEVDMKLKPGNIVDGLLDSSAICGILFAHFESQNDIENIISAVEKAFVLEVDTSETINNQQEEKK
ncbi:ATP-grasp domain-containing protein [Fictibacillus sp. KIGAM418]|uniref:ATP-grasp domain-containing protein n=1 Tax=Fictibacillus marinisediminis TaxID=2878389 RepID=A0A9X1XHB9_9BACL|nr:ATP-grasp domain-containing protein [Fictibacillus marinisediminis]MCK6258990.1 ATP-grasp domain-containing protein [Fictibacillus marinisediminis]